MRHNLDEPTVTGVRMLISKPKSQEMSELEYKRYMCVVCGWIYDEAEGWPEDGIHPGTKWEDIPDDFECPDCGVGKEDFEMMEI